MSLFDTASENIILISYPSGGFGNFIYHVLTNYADRTVKIKKNNFTFSSTGDSHNTKKYTNVYYHDQLNYQPLIDDDVDIQNKKILVLCDNGISNDSYTCVNKVFPNAKIVRTTITHLTRPVIYQTCVIKAMRSNEIEENQAHVANYWQDYNETYALRENFTLLYHNWPFSNKWLADSQCVNLNLESLITDTYNTLVQLIQNLQMQVINESGLQEVIMRWQHVNKEYFQVYYNCKKIAHALDNYINIDLTDITNLHDQGYINYWIEQKHNITIPVYDYKNWFSNTCELRKVINRLNETKNINHK